MPAQSRERWCFITICALTLLAYSRSFWSPFNLDDYSFILHNPALDAPTLDGALKFARARLLPFATFAINHAISGEEVFGYHVVNFAIHLLATLAVYRLVLALCRSPRLNGSWVATQRLPIAAAAAFIFACHPIQVQSVTYIVQRIAALATLFYVGSVVLYVRARNIQSGTQSGRPTLAFAGSIALAVAAFLSKENTASLPLTIMLTEWTFYPKAGAGRRLLRFLPFLALVPVIPILWYVLTGARKFPTDSAQLLAHARNLIKLIAFRAHPRGDASPFDYLLTQCLVIPRYIRLVLLPWGFNIDHDVPLADGWSLTVAAGFVFLAALFGSGLYALRRHPLVGYAVVWIFLGLAVESSILPIQDTMVEHRMYLSMPGVALLLGVAVAFALDRWPAQARTAGALVVAVLCALTFMRNELWRDPILLWQDAVDKSPGKARAHANLGTALHHAGRLDEAIARYCKAIELDPRSHQAQTNAYTAMSEKMEQEIENDPSLLEGLTVGEDGTVELDVPDPCQRPEPKG